MNSLVDYTDSEGEEEEENHHIDFFIPQATSTQVSINFIVVYKNYVKSA